MKERIPEIGFGDFSQEKIILTDEQCRDIRWQVDAIKVFLEMMINGAEKGEIIKGLALNGMNMLDEALQRMCKLWGYEHALAKMHARWDKQIESLLTENAALRRQCGMKVSLEDWREHTKFFFEALERWVESTGLSIGGSSINNQGLLNTWIHTKYIYIRRDGKPESKAIAEKGFELIKADYSTCAALANTTSNFRLLHEMVAELSPYAQIMKIESNGLFIEHIEVMLKEVDCLSHYIRPVS